MHDRRLCLRVRIALSQADNAFVRVNTNPEISDSANMNADSARKIDGFNSRNFHGRRFRRASELSPSLVKIVKIIVDNIGGRDLDCSCQLRRLRSVFSLTSSSGDIVAKRCEVLAARSAAPSTGHPSQIGWSFIYASRTQIARKESPSHRFRHWHRA